MGMGQALCEETRYLEGLPAHASFLEYRMPTMAESPPSKSTSSKATTVRAIRGKGGQRRARLAGFPPAMVNAIANAIGIDFDELPVTPDRVVDALIQRRRKAKLTRDCEGRIVTVRSPNCVSRSPHTIKEAVAALLAHPRSRLVAGGTDLLVNIRRGISRPDLLVDISGIGEPAEINADDDRTTIGAGVTIAAIAGNAAISARYRALAQAAGAVAAPATARSGNVRRQSVPRYPLHLLQSKRMVAEANAYCLKNRGDTCHVAPQGNAAMPPLRRSCAGSAGSRRRGGYRRCAGRPANSSERALCRGRSGRI